MANFSRRPLRCGWGNSGRLNLSLCPLSNHLPTNAQNDSLTRSVRGMASSPPASPLRYEILAGLSDGHTGGVAAIAFSPFGTYLATAGLDSQVCIWTLSNQRLLHVVRGSRPALSLVWLESQEDSLLFGIEDGAILVLRITPVSASSVAFRVPSKLQIAQPSSHTVLGSQVSS